MIYAVLAGGMKYPENNEEMRIFIETFAQTATTAIGQCVENNGMMPIGGLQVVSTPMGLMFFQSMITVEIPTDMTEHRTKPRKLRPGTLN